MQLDEKQKARLQEHLDKYVGAAASPCTMCQSRKWSVLDRVMEVREFGQGGLLVGGVVIPVIVLTCDTCGNLLLMNAVQAGVLEPFAKPAAASAVKQP